MFLIISIVGALLSLDATVVGNFMISRPIVAAPIIGWILGDINTGFAIGIIFEMLWVNLIYVGAMVPINLTIFTTLVLGVNYTVPHRGDAFTMFVILIALPIVYLFKHIEILVRTWNSRMARKVDDCINNHKSACITFVMAYSITFFFLASFVYLIIVLPVTEQIAKVLYFQLPLTFIKALEASYSILPIIGFAAMFNHFFQRSLKHHKAAHNGQQH
ncbi:MAG: PTS sugar transporter subunit IIC [Elusimicrobiota bacterium]